MVHHQQKQKNNIKGANLLVIFLIWQFSLRTLISFFYLTATISIFLFSGTRSISRCINLFPCRDLRKIDSRKNFLFLQESHLFYPKRAILLGIKSVKNTFNKNKWETYDGWGPKHEQFNLLARLTYLWCSFTRLMNKIFSIKYYVNIQTYIKIGLQPHCK